MPLFIRGYHRGVTKRELNCLITYQRDRRRLDILACLMILYPLSTILIVHLEYGRFRKCNGVGIYVDNLIPQHPWHIGDM